MRAWERDDPQFPRRTAGKQAKNIDGNGENPHNDKKTQVI